MGTIGDQQLATLSGTGTIGDRLRASVATSAFSGTLDDLEKRLGAISSFIEKVAPTTQTALVDGVSSAASTSVTFTIPNTVDTGDWLLIAAVHRKDGTLQCSIGTGLGQVSDYANHEMNVWSYQVQEADVPGTTTFTVSSTSTFTNFSACVVPVTGSEGIDDTAAPVALGFTNTPDAPSVTTTQNNSRAYCFVSGVTSSNYTVSGVGYDEIAEATTGTAGLYVFSYLKEEAGVTGGMEATCTAGSVNHYGATIAMKGS